MDLESGAKERPPKTQPAGSGQVKNSANGHIPLLVFCWAGSEQGRGRTLLLLAATGMDTLRSPLRAPGWLRS